MSRIAVVSVILVLAIGLARPASAGEVVEGDGYRFRLPDGFSPLEMSEIADIEEARQALDMMNSMLSSFMEMDMKLFMRQRGDTPDAVIVVFAIHLEDEMADAMRSQMNLDQLEAQMRVAQDELDMMGVPVELGNIQRIEVGAKQKALELEMSVEDPNFGDLTAAHMLFAIDEDSICMMSLQGLTTNAVEDTTTWRTMVSSFRLQPRETVWTLVLRYGPFALGGLVLLIAFVLLKRPAGTREPARMYTRASGSSSGAGAHAPGFSRALDGLPTYGGAQAALLGTNGTAPGAARVDEAPSPGRVIAPKIPRATPRDVDVVGAGVPVGVPPQPPPPPPPPTQEQVHAQAHVQAQAQVQAAPLPDAPGPTVRPAVRTPVVTPTPEPSPASEAPAEPAPSGLDILSTPALDVRPSDDIPTNVAHRESPNVPPAENAPGRGE